MNQINLHRVRGLHITPSRENDEFKFWLTRIRVEDDSPTGTEIQLFSDGIIVDTRDADALDRIERAVREYTAVIVGDPTNLEELKQARTRLVSELRVALRDSGRLLKSGGGTSASAADGPVYVGRAVSGRLVRPS